eukprot:TRINITY_DN35552_c0_g1_i1.p2 TRINITY_DN35552_c0_g1~~TRINITY_DN35552_c0_g1_i1.p2  ORF type:complete len:127 (+),score=59.23 TRINITY_DN35552_c0_g1_i1:26-382(+)
MAAPGKCVYEVNLSINSDIAELYLSHLKKHVEDMLKIEGFENAVVTHRKHADEMKEDDGKKLATVSYVVRDRQALETYFKDHAAEMRKEMMDLFPEKDGAPQFTASRRIHEISQVFNF